MNLMSLWKLNTSCPIRIKRLVFCNLDWCEWWRVFTSPILTFHTRSLAGCTGWTCENLITWLQCPRSLCLSCASRILTFKHAHKRHETGPQDKPVWWQSRKTCCLTWCCVDLLSWIFLASQECDNFANWVGMLLCIREWYLNKHLAWKNPQLLGKMHLWYEAGRFALSCCKWNEQNEHWSASKLINWVTYDNEIWAAHVYLSNILLYMPPMLCNKCRCLKSFGNKTKYRPNIP